MKRFLVIALGVCVFAISAFAQNVSIGGIVVRAGSSERLSKARVELQTDGNGDRVIDSMTTEGDGRFQFQNVKPGRYRLSVTRQGYVRSPLTITVTAGQPIPDAQLAMTSSGAISGHIYDVNAEPLGNVEVQALKASYPQGRRVLTLARSVITSDLGEYRLFGLAAGRYYIVAAHLEAQSELARMFRSAGQTSFQVGINGSSFYARGNADTALGPLVPVDDDDPQAERYVPIYFPGAPDEVSASPVDLRTGSDFGGVNIVVSPVRPRHVRGLVVDSAGRPTNAGVMSSAGDFNSPKIGASGAAANGAFDLVLAPGSHVLIANSPEGTGYTTVQVADADIDNVMITTLPTFDIRGRLTVESKTGIKRDLGQLRITLQRDSAAGLALKPSSYSVPLPDGSLTLSASAGDYRVNIAQLPQDMYVKSIRLGNTDVLNGGLHLDRPPSTPIEIVLSTEAGAVEGAVLNNQQQPVSDISVVLVPDVRVRTELYRTTVTDASGRYRLDRIPPGDYQLFAWTEVENDAWFDPEFMRNYENRGISVHLAESATEQVQIPAIP